MSEGSILPPTTSHCSCPPCQALAERCDEAILRLYRRKLLVPGWAGELDGVEITYVGAHADGPKTLRAILEQAHLILGPRTVVDGSELGKRLLRLSLVQKGIALRGKGRLGAARRRAVRPPGITDYPTAQTAIDALPKGPSSAAAGGGR